MFLRLAALVSLSLVAFACGPRPVPAEDIPDAPGPIAGLVEISVTPVDLDLLIDGTTPATATYTATGRFDDGHLEDVTDRVAWTLADQSLGGFNVGAFTSVLTHGGVTRVVANRGGIIGQTGLTLRLRQRHVDPAATGLPTDPAMPFTGPAAPSRAPDLVYPNDGVLLPPNLSRLEVHFMPGPSNTLFEITFENVLTDIKVYTRCVVPMNGGCIYTPDPAVWTWISDTNRGSEPVIVRVRGTDDAGSGVGTSTDIDMSFSVDDVRGGIYYWKTSGLTSSAVMRFDFGDVTQTTATEFVGPSAAGGRCVGCHALSRDGKKLVAAAGGWDVKDSLIVDVATATRTATPAKAAFASWNPAGTAYVGVYAYAGTPTHNLMLIDGTSGVQTGTIDVGATATQSTSHPDWSPDGTRIAYVRQGAAYEDGVNNQRFYNGGIHLVTAQASGAFGAPTVIVPAVAGKNHYYPAFSPDGKLLAYDESTCPTGTAHVNCNADSDPSATMFVVAPVAGSTPVALTQANARGTLDTTSELTNSWPKWAPFEFQRTADPASRLVWMTFASSRRYGLRTPPAGSGNGEAATGTLVWMVAIDPDLAAAGVDPSYPAFALPFQDVTTSNHIAQWTEEVVVIQ